MENIYTEDELQKRKEEFKKSMNLSVNNIDLETRCNYAPLNLPPKVEELLLRIAKRFLEPKF
jgi:hypothetical protein